MTEAIAIGMVLLKAQVMPSDPAENMAVSLAISALAFMTTIIIGRPIITYLRLKKVGKKVRLELEKHQEKRGRPRWAGS